MKLILANGLRILYQDMPVSHTVTAALFLPVGTWQEEASQQGITHLTEHLCFRGVGKMPQADFYRKIEGIGAYLRAATYLDYTVFEITVTLEHFADAVDILCELFQPNQWSPLDIRREKEIVACEQRGKGFDFVRELLHRYDKRPNILGSVSSVARISHKQLTLWKSIMFQPTQAVVVLAGALDDDGLKLALDKFASIAMPTLLIPDKRWRKQARFGRRSANDDSLYIEETDAALIGLTFDLCADENYDKTLDLLCSALAAGMYTPLLMRLREELVLVEHIDCGWSDCADGYVLYLTFEIVQEKLPQLLHELLILLPQIADSCDSHLVDNTKACFATTQAALADNPKELAYQMGELALRGEWVEDIDEIIDRYQTITNEDVQKLLRQLFCPAAMAITVVTDGSEEDIEQVEQAMQHLRSNWGCKK